MASSLSSLQSDLSQDGRRYGSSIYSNAVSASNSSREGLQATSDEADDLKDFDVCSISRFPLKRLPRLRDY